jgi:hypothetical protein
MTKSDKRSHYSLLKLENAVTGKKQVHDGYSLQQQLQQGCEENQDNDNLKEKHNLVKTPRIQVSAVTERPSQR